MEINPILFNQSMRTATAIAIKDIKKKTIVKIAPADIGATSVIESSISSLI